ncbi:hypothetical protein [Microbispora rosea]
MPNYLKWLEERFIEPEGYFEAVHLLLKEHAILLAGAPGSGRTSTGQMMLHRLRNITGPIRQLSFVSADLDDQDLEPLSRDRVLIDVSGISSELFPSILMRLESVRSKVAQQQGFLVAVVSDENQAFLEGDLARLVVHIGRPAGTEVLLKHLNKDGVPATLAQVSRPDFPGIPMRSISRIARLVHIARAQGSGGIKEWISRAFEAYAGDAQGVVEKVADLAAMDRALLLAAAMLSGARADAVYEAGEALHETMHLPPDDRPLLGRPGLSVRLGELKVASINKHGRVMFDTLGFDAAVRSHFWADHHGLRDKLREWVARLVESPALTASERDAVIVRFAEQVLNLGRYDDLLRLCAGWTAAGSSPQRWPDAVRALQLALEDSRCSGLIRHRIITWAQEPNLPFERGQVLVEVCSDVLARIDALSALVRLRHLARQDDPRTSSAAREALARMMGEGPWFARQLLTRVVRRLESLHPPRNADYQLFLWLTAPDRDYPLVSASDMRPLLVEGWRALMDRANQELWERAIHRWFSAVADGVVAEETLGILLDASAESAPSLTKLYVAAMRCRRDIESGLVLDLVTRFCQKIDALQGL